MTLSFSLPNRRPRRVLVAVLAAVLAVVLAGLAAGCSGPKPAARTSELPEAFPNHTLSQIRQQILLPTDSLTSFRAEARGAVRSPERNGSFNAHVRQQRNDSLYMSFSLFGFEGARMLITPDSFFVYDRQKKRLMVGAVADAQDYLPIPVTVDQSFSNLLGLLAPEAGIDWTVNADSSLYYMRDPERQRVYVVDPTTWRVVRYAEHTSSGELVEERLFGEFDRVEGVLVPRRVIFRRPADGIMAMLYYRELDLNPPDLSFDLDVGNGVQRVSVP